MCGGRRAESGRNGFIVDVQSAYYWKILVEVTAFRTLLALEALLNAELEALLSAVKEP